MNSSEISLVIPAILSSPTFQPSHLPAFSKIVHPSSGGKVRNFNFKATLNIDKEIGYREGEANQLGNIGLIYRDKGDLNEALKNLRAALNILDSHGLAYERDIFCRAIDLIMNER